MIGQPLADAKLAAARAVDALTADDYFAVVAYSTDARVLVPHGRATPEHKAKAKAAIESIRAEGGTNISGGVSLGAEQLAGRSDDDIGRVVLISDGQANEGIYDRQGLANLAGQLASGGVSITAVGVGLDFDEVTMTEMAVAGRGNYYFVERASDLAGMFERELDSLGETVVVDARLAVTPGSNVEVLDAYGYRVDRANGDVIVPIADLRAGERRKVVLRVRVRADHAGAMDLVSTELTWREVGQHQERIAKGTVGVTVTDDARAVAASTVIEADVHVQEAQMSRALDEATNAYEQGDYDRARGILQSQAEAAAASPGYAADETLKLRVQGAKDRAEANFAAEPTGKGAGGSRAKKANRADAYELAR
jgi:Ca-activated chloride channel family protein